MPDLPSESLCVAGEPTGEQDSIEQPRDAGPPRQRGRPTSAPCATRPRPCPAPTDAQFSPPVTHAANTILLQSPTCQQRCRPSGRRPGPFTSTWTRTIPRTTLRTSGRRATSAATTARLANAAVAHSVFALHVCARPCKISPTRAASFGPVTLAVRTCCEPARACACVREIECNPVDVATAARKNEPRMGGILGGGERLLGQFLP